MGFRIVGDFGVGRIASVGSLWGVCVLVGCLSCQVAPAFADIGLADGRVYEMVSPANNNEANVYVPFSINQGILNYGQGGVFTKLPFEVSANGEAVAYLGAPTVGGIGNTGSGFGNEYLATRNAGGGWTQENLQPPGVKSTFYQAFSSDLSVGVLQSGEPGEPEVSSLAQGAPGGGYSVLYTHSDIEPSGTEGGYRPFFTITPPEPAVEFLAHSVPKLDDGISDPLAYSGASANFGQLLFEADGALTSN